MACSHEGFRDISSTYDPRRQVLVFVWTCERCGKRMGEAGRTNYQPRFDPTGNDGRLRAGPLNG